MGEEIKELLLSVFPILISAAALLSSIFIGRKQVEISQIQSDLQNKIELFLVLGTYRAAAGQVPAVIVRNAGNSVVYLVKYEWNGKEYPLNCFILPPMSVCADANYHIALPEDGSDHVSFRLKFKDWNLRGWMTEGYLDFRDGAWALVYSPCKRKEDT